MRQLVSTNQKGKILGIFCSVKLTKLVCLLKLKAVLAENHENLNDSNMYGLFDARE